MQKSFGKYRMVYGHLWKSYGMSWQVRLSYLLRLLSRMFKLIAIPIAISLIITRLAAGDFTGARYAVLILVGFSLLIGIVGPLVKYVGMLGEEKAYRQMTADYFSKLVHADLDYFNSNLAGYLTAATRQYVDSGMQFVRNVRDRYLETILSIIFPLCVIIWIDLWLGLVTLVLSLVQATYLLWASHAINPYRTHSRELYKRNSGLMADIISNILAVKSTAQEEVYTSRVEDGVRKEADAFRERLTVQAKLNYVREVITVTFFLVLLWVTVGRMSSGDINLGGAVLVVTYTTTILTAIYALTDNLDEHDDLVDKIIPSFDILNRVNRVSDPVNSMVFKKVRGDIEFHDVRYSYDCNNDRCPVLDGFSLKIPAGQKLGIVGISGAGKSTLTKLLLRFDNVTSGKITIDGKNVNDVTQNDLRSSIAYVPQEPLLFHTSVKENVVLAHPTATDQQIETALRTAHAWEFVKQLPNKTDSVVGERGVKLSGGQKQRIAIARAFLQNSPIMILDEATSALDSESEQIIKSSFAKILKGRTAIVVAHRLSTLSDMDRTIVIDNGKLIEDGTHDELVAKGGVYAKLWKRQQRLRVD